MMRRSTALHLAAALLLTMPVLLSCATSGTGPLAAAEARDPIATMMAKSERADGMLTMYKDADGGKVWLELPAPGEDGVIGEYLYVEGLATGLGSNPVGLDRGQLGASRFLILRRVGNRVLFEEPNLGFRALAAGDSEARATRESFAPSVLWAGPVETTGPSGSLLVDLTSFLVRDAHSVERQLDNTGQGSYALDPERSAVDLANCHAFPDNLVFESVLTYAGRKPGALVAATVPNGSSFSLVQYQSLVRLPDEGYEPRPFDPRFASLAIYFQDYAAPLAESIEKRWIVRHRIAADGPDSELVFYVDPGIPEPIRGAVVDGASWWSDAFAAAGYPDLYRVEMLPEDAHPLDIRYNVIQWVHRSTRGWSYGGGVIDPRTGEMLKGHVNLGSLRVRQDRLIFEGLLGTEKTGSGDADDPIQLALARIRQLSAHEVGHALGFSHNFAASTYKGRASVMDYPAPWVRPAADGSLDVTEAYDDGIGEWDVHATRFAYGEPESGESAAAAIERLASEGRESGYLFLSDWDARPAGAAHPLANLWDNGADPVAALEEILEVRRRTLARFGRDNLPAGEPLALLEEVFATVYFQHRYQLEATVKSVGGLLYSYSLRDDSGGEVRRVASDVQRAALAAVLGAMTLEALDVPEEALGLLAPRPFGYGSNRELLSHRTAPGFDALGAARTAADLVVAGLLQPERAARLIDQHRRDPSQLGFAEVVQAVVEAAFEAGAPGDALRSAAIRAEVQEVVVGHLMRLAADGEAHGTARAQADEALRKARLRLRAGVHGEFLRAQIRRFQERQLADELVPVAAPEIPPGSPIGLPGQMDGFCSHGAIGYEPGGFEEGISARRTGE